MKIYKEIKKFIKERVKRKHDRIKKSQNHSIITIIFTCMSYVAYSPNRRTTYLQNRFSLMRRIFTLKNQTSILISNRKLSIFVRVCLSNLANRPRRIKYSYNKFTKRESDFYLKYIHISIFIHSFLL